MKNSRRIWNVVAALAISVVGWRGALAWAQEDASSESGSAELESAPESTEPASGGTAAAPMPAASPTGLISVDFKDADVRLVLRTFALKTGVDIVASPDVEGLVTIKLTDVPWEQALDILLRTYGFAYERKGNVIRVLTLVGVEQEALATDVFPLNYAKSKEVHDIVKEMLSDRGKAKFDERTNTVIVTDLPSTLFQLKAVVERLDRPTPQVKIESKIIETKLTKDDNLGVNWFDAATIGATATTLPTTFPFPGGKDFGEFGAAFIPRTSNLSPTTGAALTRGRVPETGGQFTFGTISGGTYSMTLNMLKQRVNTNIVSNPTITTLNNMEATVQVGEDINIPNFQIDSSTGRATVTGFQTRSTGVILKVTPHVNLQKEIVLDLAPEITEIGATFDTFASGIQFPRFTVQKAKTQVRTRDGETVVIGGLVKRKLVKTVDKVPLLGDLPILGGLFTNQRHQTDPHQDLLIFVTCTLVADQTAGSAVAAQTNPPGE